MTCADSRPLLPDLLDGLLEASEESRVRAHLGECAACAAALAAAESERARWARPYAVPEAPADLPARVRALGLAPRSPSHWVRYAASFAAGVLLTLALGAWRAPATVAATSPTVPAATASVPDSRPPDAPQPLRRIR
jgi:anti-sigma factor RsiW